jgi:hypothetical protein
MGLPVQTRRDTPPMYKALFGQEPKITALRIAARDRRATAQVRENSHGGSVGLSLADIQTHNGDIDEEIW